MLVLFLRKKIFVFCISSFLMSSFSRVCKKDFFVTFDNWRSLVNWKISRDRIFFKIFNKPLSVISQWKRYTFSTFENLDSARTLIKVLLLPFSWTESGNLIWCFHRPRSHCFAFIHILHHKVRDIWNLYWMFLGMTKVSVTKCAEASLNMRYW